MAREDEGRGKRETRERQERNKRETRERQERDKRETRERQESCKDNAREVQKEDERGARKRRTHAKDSASANLNCTFRFRTPSDNRLHIESVFEAGQVKKCKAERQRCGREAGRDNVENACTCPPGLRRPTTSSEMSYKRMSMSVADVIRIVRPTWQQKRGKVEVR
jgi:hypothetical protein